MQFLQRDGTKRCEHDSEVSSEVAQEKQAGCPQPLTVFGIIPTMVGQFRGKQVTAASYFLLHFKHL